MHSYHSALKDCFVRVNHICDVYQVSVRRLFGGDVKLNGISSSRNE
jgi:hypothetical protein